MIHIKMKIIIKNKNHYTIELAVVLALTFKKEVQKK